MPITELKIIVLAGGNSTRMGSSKHLLPLADGEPLLLHVIRRAHSIFHESRTDRVFVSFRNRQQLGAIEGSLHGLAQILFDQDISDFPDANKSDIGPAGGLLRALEADSTAHWLVIACDYPLLPAFALRYLQEKFVEPVTSFKNSSGKCEPLLSIWSPMALQYLRRNVAAGLSGPSKTIMQLGGTLIDAMDELWLTNTNTKEEWQWALKAMPNVQ